MRNLSTTTRFRAWLLRTFRGRSAADAEWEEDLPLSAGAPESFHLGDLTIDVAPRGLKAAGINPPSIVHTVRVTGSAPGRPWSSSYGLPPRQASARLAADAALDELDEVHREPQQWRLRVTDGMSEEEAEAMEDSPGMARDLEAARWVGPELDPYRARRRETGTWLEP